MSLNCDVCQERDLQRLNCWAHVWRCKPGDSWVWKWYINLRVGTKGPAYAVVKPPYNRAYKYRASAIKACERALGRMGMHVELRFYQEQP